VLLCSDGLTEMVGSYEIAGLLAAQADMHETARRLVDLANEAGGRDNISSSSSRSAARTRRRPPLARRKKVETVARPLIGSLLQAGRIGRDTTI